MPEDIYELISLGARYWFALLGVLIVLRSFSWLRKDRRAKHKRLKRLPDAGMIGEMVVLRGSDELPEGCAIPVPREGTLGFLRTCDMVVPVDGVAPHHIDFAFQDGRGLLLFPWNGCECTMDGEELTARSKTKHFPMHHGSRLQVGDALLRLRLLRAWRQSTAALLRLICRTTWLLCPRRKRRTGRKRLMCITRFRPPGRTPRDGMRRFRRRGGRIPARCRSRGRIRLTVSKIRPMASRNSLGWGPTGMARAGAWRLRSSHTGSIRGSSCR